MATKNSAPGTAVTEPRAWTTLVEASMAYAENTKVPLEQSIAEIITMIRKAGAESVGQMHERDRFVIVFALGDRRMKFQVPLITTWDGPTRGGNGREIDVRAKIEQANRQKGRALMLVIKAKLESVESGVETFEEAFLANIMLADGATVYERMAEPIAIEYKSGRVQPLQLTGPAQ
jgi:hypothetical protein